MASFFARQLNFLLSLPRMRYSFIGGLYTNALSAREKMLYIAMKYAAVSRLEGDYFEFGVYAGGNMAAAFHISRRHLPRLQFYAFDSFEGLPETEIRDGHFEPFQKGQFSCDEKTFRTNLARKGVDMSRIHTIPGWYKDTLNEKTTSQIPAKKAAIVYIDCDLYESAAAVLAFVTPYLEDGSLILFDEWFAYRARPDRGERRAFAEWLTRHPEIAATEYHTFGWSGKSFIIHRASSHER